MHYINHPLRSLLTVPYSPHNHRKIEQCRKTIIKFYLTSVGCTKKTLEHYTITQQTMKIHVEEYIFILLRRLIKELDKLQPYSGSEMDPTLT